MLVAMIRFVVLVPSTMPRVALIVKPEKSDWSVPPLISTSEALVTVGLMPNAPPAPDAPSARFTSNTPLRICTWPVNVLAPESTRCEVALFSVTLTPDTFTLAPIIALIEVEPFPMPELVTVPVLFRLLPEIVMPLAVAPLLSSTRLAVPVIPPLSVKTPVPAF